MLRSNARYEVDDLFGLTLVAENVHFVGTLSGLYDPFLSSLYSRLLISHRPRREEYDGIGIVIITFMAALLRKQAKLISKHWHNQAPCKLSLFGHCDFPLTRGSDCDLRWAMKLRDHPLMSYRGVNNWPPAWTRTRDNSVKTLRGEIGVLSYVHSNALSSSRCYLVIDYEGETYVGTLIFEDKAFCNQVCNLLGLHLKRTIKEIGDLDLSETL